MLQDRAEDDFVIVQDVDVTQDDWTLWRNSLAQMFIAMREESRLSRTSPHSEGLHETAFLCSSSSFCYFGATYMPQVV